MGSYTPKYINPDEKNKYGSKSTRVTTPPSTSGAYQNVNSGESQRYRTSQNQLGEQTYNLRYGGSDYTINQSQIDWIRDRYAKEAAKSYRNTPDDYTRMLSGALPSAFENSYSGSNLDKQLKSMNMPSSKYLAKYLGDYVNWYGDGTSYKFDDKAKGSISDKFKSDWTYEYTIEDQKRKAAGQMPLAIEAKYGDNRRDYELMQQGLPPESMLSDYVGAYEKVEYETAKKNQLYDTATIKIMEAEAALGGYKQLSDEERIKIFDEVYADAQYDDIRQLWQKSPVEDKSDGVTDSLAELDSKWSKAGKKEATSGEPTISWTDFIGGYEKRKSKVVVNKTAYETAITEMQKQTTSQAIDKDKVVEYVRSRSGDRPAEIFADMYAAGLPIGRVMEAKKYLLGQATTPDEKEAIRSAAREAANAYTNDAMENVAGFVSDIFSPEKQAERKAAREGKRSGDAAVKNGVVALYDQGATSTIDADDAEKIFKSHLVYDEKGKPTKESIELATNMMYEAGATTSVVLEVGKRAGMKSNFLSKDYWENQLAIEQQATQEAFDQTSGFQAPKVVEENKPRYDIKGFNQSFADVVAERDLAQRKELIDASYKANVESGNMTSADFYNAVRRSGWGDTIDVAKDAEAYYNDVYAPKFAKNGEQLPKWEEIDQAAFIANFESGKDLNPDIHKTTEEIVQGSLSRAFMAPAMEIAKGTIGFLDMATAKASGRTEAWELTNLYSDVSQKSEGVSSNQSVGSQAASISSTVAGQLVRMYTVSQIGSGVLSMFSKGASAVAGAVSQTNAGNILSQIAANATPAMTKGASALVKGTKWLISSSPFIATSMGSYYTEAVQSGANVDQAVLYGTVCGAMEGALEAVGTELWLGRMFGGQSVAKGIISAGKAAFKSGAILPKALMIRLVSSTLGNALEEGASYAVSIGMQKATYNKDAQFDWTEAGNQALMGGLIGLLGAGMNAGADTQSNILAEFMNSKAGQEWLADDKNNSAFTDMFVMSTIADTVPDQVRSAMRMQENAKSVSDVSAMVRDIDQHSRQMDAGQKQYADDIAKIDAELGKKQDAVAVLSAKMEQAAADESVAGMKKWSKIVEQLQVAQQELDVEQKQAQAKRTERNAAFTETQEQHKIAISKAQESLKGVAVSVAEAFDPQISQIRDLVRDKVVAVPNEIAQEILTKMDAAHAGKLFDYIQTKNDLYQRQYESVTGLPQTPTSPAQPAGAAQTSEAPTAQPTAENASIVSTEPRVTNAADALSEYKAELEAMASENQTSIEDRLSFSGEELPYVRVGLKVSKSASDKAIGTVKDYFKSWRGMAIHEQFQREVDGVVLQVLSDNPKYTENPDAIVSRLTNAFKHVSIDYNPADMGYKGYDGREIESIRTLMRSQAFALGYYKNDGTLKRDFNEETRKSAFGSIMLKKKATKRGEVLSNIDTFYAEELTPRYPDLFPEKISTPQDQLDKMVEFMNATKRQEGVSIYNVDGGVTAYEIASHTADGLINDLIGAYNELRTQRGTKSNDNTGKATETTTVVAEANSSTQASQPETVAEKSEATPANPAETMGIVDPKLQEGVNALRTFERAAYKRIVSGAAGTERASRVQKKLGVGGASIDASAQGIRNSRGQIQYILNDALVDINGTPMGKSFMKLFEQIPQEKWGDFQKYLLAKHTEARMTLEQRGYGNDKPVLASESGALDPDGNPTAMDANEAAALAARLEAENPIFLSTRDGYRSWWRNFMRSWAVDGGLMTDVQFNALDAKYPDYVPTYRVDKSGVGGASSATRNSVTVASAIRNATGSTDEIQDIRVSISDMISKYVTMERRNELVQNLYNFAELHTKAAAEFATIFDEESDWSPDVDFVSFDELANKSAAEVKDGQYIIRGFRDGEKVSMYVSKDVYDAVNYLTNPTDVSIRSKHENEILKGARAITKPIKGAITGYNPFFAVMNFARDAQTYFVNTNANAVDTFTNIGKAVAERGKNSALWQSYLALGGNASGYITGQQMTDAKVTGKGKVANVVDKAGKAIGWLGGYTENMFRFAEYINGVNKYGNTAEGRRNAMADAADVTVNFSRSGAYTKAADSFCLYLNANVQGLDKMARTIAKAPGKTALRGLSLAAIALLIRYISDNDDNPHYQNLTNYAKDSNFLIPNVFGERDENGYCTTFIKIPKSREYGTLLVATVERAARFADGESFDDAFADLGKDIGSSIGIRLEPFWSAASAISNNKNYFGNDIVPMYMQGEAAPDQTTAQTSVISDAISERLYEMGTEVSPMLIDYVINQYGGFYGQLLTSATAKDSGGVGGVLANTVTDKFVADPLYQSGVVSRFYDTMDEAQHLARSSQRNREKFGISATSKDEAGYENLDGYKKQIAKLRKQEREIMANELDTPERKAKIDAIREQINTVAAQGIAAWNGR